MVGTRSIPEFPHESQKALYNKRREFALMANVPFDPDVEQLFVGALDDVMVSAVLEKFTKEIEACTKKASRKKSKGKVMTPPVTEPTDGPEGSGPKDPANDGNEPANDDDADGSADEESFISSSIDDSDDDDDDPRRRTSKKDKQTVRGRTPRVDTSKTSKKLFKMDPPAKYSGERDKDHTYNMVHQFLSQLSRYFRLATYIDMDEDITEYILGSLEGFAFDWFETLDKGNTPFRWQEFETAFRKKFIPRDHVQISLRKYGAIKQNGRPVSEYIVERERLENTLGAAISEDLKESSFCDNLDGELIKALVAFRDLSYEQYKRKAESTDQEMRERKLYAKKTSSYAPKSTTKGYGEKPTKQTSTGQKPQKSDKPKTKQTDGPSKNQLRKEGLCFTCKREGHIAKDCPEKPEEPNTASIRICTSPKAKRISQYTKRDGRSYRDVVSNKPKVTVPTIAVKDDEMDGKPTPMMTMIPINKVPAKVLIDSGSSDDFIGTHFVTTNHISAQRHEMPLSIQQAIRGSKPKSNATATVNVQFGEWTRRVKAHTAGIAGYDAIIGVPTLAAGGAIIDVKNRMVHFAEWDVTLHCKIPEPMPRINK